MKATEDFFELFLVAHIVCAAERVYSEGMKLENLAIEVLDNHIHLAPNTASKQSYHHCSYASDIR